MYRTVIFDLDGVITSEEKFWDSAALTTAELLGVKPEDPARLRRIFFAADDVIRLLKERGVNSNWDLTYLVWAFWETDGHAVYERLCATEEDALSLYEHAAALLYRKYGGDPADFVRGGKWWQWIADSFQEWFLGSETFAAVNHKEPIGERRGLWDAEEPIVGREKLCRTLSGLKNAGVSLRIGTARPEPEATAPLKRWGVFPLFDAEGVATYEHIRAAEKALGRGGLGKPHPYIFIKSYLGISTDDAVIVNGSYPADFSDCLVVGDAGADLFAAKRMGADFAAVLTGIAGEDARPFFEKNGADFILPDITGLLPILTEK